MARPSRHIFVLTLLAVLLPLTACGSDEPSDATGVGDIVQAREGVDTEGSAKGSLMLPSGRLDIRAGKPITSLVADETREHEARTAPDGGVFLPITWTFRTADMETLARVFGRALPVEMTLVSGGEEYTLAPPEVARNGESIEAYYVAVEGSGKKAEIQVEYAGETQTLDLVSGKRKAGLAQGLYDLDPTQYSEELKPCPSDGWLDEGPLVQATFTCTRSDTVVVPFVDGEWAPKGSTFVVIGLTSDLTSFTAYTATGGGATYTVASSREKSKLGGQSPSRILEEKVLAGGAAGFLVFTVSGKVPKDLVFHRTYTLVRQAVQGDIDAPYTRKVDVVGNLPLG